MTRRRALGAALPLGALAALALPGVASADTLEAVNNGVLKDTVPINTLWVVVAAVLVLFMQAGLRYARDRFLAREERRHRRRQDPHQPLDRGHLLLGRGLRLRLRQGRASSSASGHTGFFLQCSATRSRPSR